jgi:hypothetical protein
VELYVPRVTRVPDVPKIKFIQLFADACPTAVPFEMTIPVLLENNDRRAI